MIRFVENCRVLVATLIVAAGIPVSRLAAVPIEKFDQKVDVSCAPSGTCLRSLRSKTTVGSHTGIVVRGGSVNSSGFSVREGVFTFEAEGSSLGSLTLTWDGDSYPDQLSGAGLSCFDLRQDGGSAIIVRGVSLKGACGGDMGAESCPPFVIETRVYDSVDPTGQVYSASLLRRSNGREEEDLIIPFSNFNRKGPRGEGKFTCVGAISLQIRFEPYSKVVFAAGPLFTNSLRPLDSPPATPTPLSPTSTPTPTPAVLHEGVPVPSSSSPASGSGPVSDSPGARETATPVPVLGDRNVPKEGSKSEVGGASRANAASEGGSSVPPAPVVERVLVAPLKGREGVSDEHRRQEPEEVIYGEIIRK